MANMKRVYIVETITDYVHKLSQEAYLSYDSARKFIENRSDKPIMIEPFLFKSEINEYRIHDMLVV